MKYVKYKIYNRFAPKEFSIICAKQNQKPPSSRV